MIRICSIGVLSDVILGFSLGAIVFVDGIPWPFYLFVVFFALLLVHDIQWHHRFERHLKIPR